MSDVMRQITAYHEAAGVPLYLNRHFVNQLVSQGFATEEEIQQAIKDGKLDIIEPIVSFPRGGR